MVWLWRNAGISALLIPDDSRKNRSDAACNLDFDVVLLEGNGWTRREYYGIFLISII